MNNERIYNPTFYDKQNAAPMDVSLGTKLEFSDECRRYSEPKVIRVEFEGSRDEQVLVRTRSHDEQKVGQEISVENLSFDRIDLSYV